jgi:RNA-binding protein YhbY
LKVVLGMATTIFDIITMSISTVLEAVFDEVEYRLARRALVKVARTKGRSAAPEMALVESVTKS